MTCGLTVQPHEMCIRQVTFSKRLTSDTIFLPKTLSFTHSTWALSPFTRRYKENRTLLPFPPLTKMLQFSRCPCSSLRTRHKQYTRHRVHMHSLHTRVWSQWQLSNTFLHVFFIFTSSSFVFVILKCDDFWQTKVFENIHVWCCCSHVYFNPRIKHTHHTSSFSVCWTQHIV